MLFYSVEILLHLAYMKRPRAEGYVAVSKHSAEKSTGKEEEVEKTTAIPYLK